MITEANPIPEILRMLFDGGARSLPLAEVGMLWTELGEALEEMSTEFVSVLSVLAEAWQGTAAMTAVAKAMPYALWMATAGLECGANGTMATGQAGNYETGDADIPQMEEIVATRTQLLNSYAANAAAWGMLSGYVAECETQMEVCTTRAITGFTGYDGNTFGTSVQFPFTPSPFITSLGFQGEAMFAATMSETMARAAAGVMTSMEMDALLAKTTLQVAEELGLEPIRMAYNLGLDGLKAGETAVGVAANQAFDGLGAKVDADHAQQESGKSAENQDFAKELQQGVQQGTQIGQQVAQMGMQMGQQAVQQGQQMLQQGVQQGTQVGQQVMQQVTQMTGQMGHAASGQTSFAPTGLTGQYTSGYSAGLGGGFSGPMGGSAGGGIRVPSGWGGSAPSLGLSNTPGMSAMKVDAGMLRGATPAAASAGSSLSSGGSGGGGMGQGVQGVAQAAKKQGSQEEEEEEQNSQFQVPDQFADGRVVTPPVIGASERARA